LKKAIIFFVAVALIVVIGFFLKNKNDQSKVCFEKKCFVVEIVSTEKDRATGLQGRVSLDKNAGMLFIFEKTDFYSFWMKKTLIPLDMIWMDKDKKVVYIAHNSQPCKNDPCPGYSPSSEGMYVLEINGGFAKKMNLNIGNFAEFYLKM